VIRGDWLGDQGRQGGRRLTPKCKREAARRSFARGFIRSDFFVSSSEWNSDCSCCWQKEEMVTSRALVSRIQIVCEQPILYSLGLRRSLVFVLGGSPAKYARGY
jgi:hypothetical protein